MSRSITLRESAWVPRTPREAFLYLRDFTNCAEWDPGVDRAWRLDDGPLREGARFEVSLKVWFLRPRMVYRLEEMTAERRIVLRSSTAWIDARDVIVLEPEAQGTRVRYVAEFTFKGPFGRLLISRPDAVEAMGRRAVAGLRRALEDDNPVPEPAQWSTLDRRLLLPILFPFTRQGFERARRRFRPVSACLEGRHVVLTGANSGLGYAAARALARRGARLTLVMRDPGRAEQALRELRRDTGSDTIDVELADLSLIGEVHALADRLLDRGQSVDVLINNAGALFNERGETSEGLERSYALLLLAPFVLTERLQPLLRDARAARVINVSSGGMYTACLRVDDLEYREREYYGAKAYAGAKRGLVILTELWAQQWADDGIVCHAMHPGWADTPGIQRSLPGFSRLVRPLLRDSEQGADTVYWLAAASEVQHGSGLFWLDRRPVPTHIGERTVEAPADRQRLVERLRHDAGRLHGASSPPDERSG
jgi:NAD(P)-dependent dehydrogenase (short-subunit alcohol dehydrogenase family)